MFDRRNAQVLAVLMMLVATTSCSGTSKGQLGEAAPENQGYRWAGEGEPGNFGSAYAFCRSTLREETTGARLQGGMGTMGTPPGGPTTIPGYTQGAQPSTYRSDISQKREFQGCMQAQGWELAGTTKPTPSMQPAPKPQSPQPVEPSE
jgi:hypothetical protein